MAKTSARMEKLKNKISKALEKKRLERAANLKNLASELKNFKIKLVPQKTIKNKNINQFLVKKRSYPKDN